MENKIEVRRYHMHAASKSSYDFVGLAALEEHRIQIEMHEVVLSLNLLMYLVTQVHLVDHSETARYQECDVC